MALETLLTRNGVLVLGIEIKTLVVKYDKKERVLLKFQTVPWTGKCNVNLWLTFV